MEELQYLKLLEQCVKHGHLTQQPDEVPRYGVHGALLRFSLLGGKIPILTTKRVAWKTSFEEMFWFLSGEKSLKMLRDKGIKIWNMWDKGENGAGPLYGYQMRHWQHYKGGEIDQLQTLINNFKKNPFSASLKITMWRPDMLDEMEIKPCHTDFQLNTYLIDKVMFGSGMLYIRSWDVAVGGPFNIAQYAMLTHLLCHHLGIYPREFVVVASNAHIYEPHREGIAKQLVRIPKSFPTISFKTKRDNIDAYTIDDIEIHGYDPDDVIKFDLVPAGKPARENVQACLQSVK